MCNHLKTRNRMYNFQATRERKEGEKRTNLMSGHKEKKITHAHVIQQKIVDTSINMSGLDSLIKKE